MIVKSIWDFTVGTTGVSPFVWTPYRCPAQTSEWADYRSPAAVRAGALQVTPRPACKVVSVCLFSLKKKDGIAFVLCVSWGGWGDSGGGRGHCEPVQKCFIWRSKFCTMGLRLLFCTVCVCVCFPRKALLLCPRSALPPHPAFILHAGVRERTCMLNSWMRPNQTKQEYTCVFCFG